MTLDITFQFVDAALKSNNTIFKVLFRPVVLVHYTLHMEIHGRVKLRCSAPGQWILGLSPGNPWSGKVTMFGPGSMDPGFEPRKSMVG
jgi:hypothetical protein